MIESLGITFYVDKGCIIQEGFSRPYLRRLILDEANYVMKKVYEGGVWETLKGMIVGP